ncbi:MAG: hypothetical protein SGBAC_012552 [Bacillariaceae sp.]
MTDSCGVLDVLAEQDPVRIPFENTPTIEYYHNTAPRLNANKDPLSDDYNQSFAGFIVAYIGFFLIWALTLAFFKWRGPSAKTGWLSGSRTTEFGIQEEASSSTVWFSSRRTKNETAVVETNKVVPKKQSLLLRIVLYTTILGIIAANGILYFNGLQNLSAATDAGIATVDQAEAQMKLSICLFDQTIDRFELAENNTAVLLTKANNICPLLQGQFCRAVNDPESCDGGRRVLIVDRAWDWVQDVVDQGQEAIQRARNFLTSVLESIQGGIEFFQEETSIRLRLQELRDDLNGKIEARLVDTKDQMETAALMVTLSSVLCLISTLVCIGLLVAHFLKKPFLLKIFFGLFLFITILMLVAAIANAVASFVVSDICIDDPDTRVIELLLLRIDFSSDILEFVARTILQSLAAGRCSEEPPTAFLLDSLDFVQNGMDAFDGWSGLFWGFESVQQSVCGADATSFSDVEEFMDTTINAQLKTTAVFLESAGRVLTCGFWMGLFEKGLHQAACYDGMEALATVSLVQFILVCFCMLVLTVRVALWDILEDDVRSATQRS